MLIDKAKPDRIQSQMYHLCQTKKWFKRGCFQPGECINLHHTSQTYLVIGIVLQVVAAITR